MNKATVILTTAVFAGLSAASAAVVDFEAPLTGMNNVLGASVPVANQLSSLTVPSGSITFASGSAYVAVITAQPPFAHVPSPLNAIASADAAGTLQYTASTMTITFMDPAGTGGLGETASFTIYGDSWGTPPGGFITAKAFTWDNVQIGSTLVIADSPNNPPGGVGLNLADCPVVSFTGGGALANINRVELSVSSLIAFDNLTYDEITPAPEPAHYAMLAGLGLVGFAIRRRMVKRA